MRFSALVVALTGLAPTAAASLEIPAAGVSAAASSSGQVAAAPFQEQESADEADGGLVGAEAALAPVPLPPSATRGLDRDFIVRLRRVVDRLATEHAMDVEVVEGLRTPERQMELYAQGRTAPGPVVTWTTNSLHLQGAAADLWLNGQPPEGESALILARVAREEGLRTLYPFDSGHIQLDGPNTGPDAHGERTAPRMTPAPTPRTPNGVAVPAPVARPATPATPARPGGDVQALSSSEMGPGSAEAAKGQLAGSVPAVAGSRDQVARSVPRAAGPASQAPEGPGRHADGVGHQRAAPTDPSSPLVPRGEVGGARGQGLPETAALAEPPRERRMPTSATEADGGARPPVQPVLVAEGPNLRALGSSGNGGGAVAPAGGVLAPPEPPAELPMPRMVRVPLDGGVEEGTLRVGLRSGRVHAEVQVVDAGLADRLVRNVREIRRSLGERGLDMGTWAVRVAPSAGTEGQTVRQGDAGSGDGFSDAQSGHRSARDRPQDRQRNARHGRSPHHEGES